MLDIKQFDYLQTNMEIKNLSMLKDGMIVDAQDYLDKWHLSIVCKIQEGSDSETVKVNFLPYPKGNRDEWISKSEIENRIGGVFSHVDQIDDKD